MTALDFLFPGCEIDEIKVCNQAMIIEVHTSKATSECPRCEQSSSRVHSYYMRTPHDLPIGGYVVRLCLTTRRFRCLNPACLQRIFTERLVDFPNPHV